MLQRKIIAALVASTFLATGCVTTPLSKKSEKTVDDNFERAEGYLKTVKPEAVKLPMVERVSTPWLGKKSVPIVKKQELPAVFYSTVTFDNSVTLQEAASRIALRYGVPVKLAREITMGAGAGTGGAVATPGAVGGTQNNVAKISYSGSLAGLLDIIASRFTAHWKYQNGAIQFFYVDTRTFKILAVPGDTTLQSQVSSSSSTQAGGGAAAGGAGGGAAAGGAAPAGGGGAAGGGAGAGGSSSSTSVSSQLSVWNGMKDSIASMLSSGGKVVVSPATGSITVTDTPEILDRVEEYVNEQNASLSRQVMFNVKVYSVLLSNSDDYQINWNLVYNSLSQKYGLTFDNNFSAVANSTGVNFKVLPGATGNAAKFAGSDILLNALSTQGKTSLVTSATVSTLNAQPVPVQVARQTSYLQSVATTVTANVGTTATLTPGTFTTGFSMNLLPNIIDKGQLLLQYSIDLSVLNKLSSITSAGNTIQTPEIDTRNFLQRVAMNTGETLILTGFEQNTDALQNQGVGDPKFAGLGGGVNATKSRDVVVVAITPVITSIR